MNSKEPSDRLGILKRQIARLRAELDEKQVIPTRRTGWIGRLKTCPLRLDKPRKNSAVLRLILTLERNRF